MVNEGWGTRGTTRLKWYMQCDIRVTISEMHIGYVAGCVCRDFLYIEMVKQRTILLLGQLQNNELHVKLQVPNVNAKCTV